MNIIETISKWVALCGVAGIALLIIMFATKGLLSSIHSTNTNNRHLDKVINYTAYITTAFFAVTFGLILIAGCIIIFNGIFK